MKITATQNNVNEAVYSRLVDTETKKLGDILGLLMSQPSGTAFTVVVNSGTHEHSFRLSDKFDLKTLVLKVEGFTKRASPKSTT